jgi:CubicO group peptidase (beta-lactamase class C family)
MVRQKIPGVAIAIVKKEGVFAAKGYGLANVELSVPVGPISLKNYLNNAAISRS